MTRKKRLALMILLVLLLLLAVVGFWVFIVYACITGRLLDSQPYLR
jgi:hypothetical protein